MNFNDYKLAYRQFRSKNTEKYPVQYPILGLLGEAGEVADKVKKIYRDQDGKIVNSNVPQVTGELGDVCWYLCALADDLGIDLIPDSKSFLPFFLPQLAESTTHLCLSVSALCKEAFIGRVGLDMQHHFDKVFHYLTCVAMNLDIDMRDVFQYNIDKLTSRQERGVLCGSGDNR